MAFTWSKNWSVANDGEVLSGSDIGTLQSDVETNVNTLVTTSAAITFVITESSEIATGIKGYVEVPFACTLTAVTLLADQTGSIVIDIWKDTYANYPPTDADSITASAVPTITSAAKSQDTTLTGWTKTVSAGDILVFNVDSCTTITSCSICLKATKT